MGTIRINQLPSGSALTDDDIFLVMDDPSGNAITKKVSASVLRSSIFGESANLQLRSGLNSEVSGIIPLQSEPVWSTDTQKLSIGDGVTYGGIPINAAGYVKPYAPSAGSNVFQSGHYVSLDNVMRNSSDLKVLSSIAGTVGNTRGMCAVDLSMSRTNANFVASGDYSFIGGGLDGQAIGNNSASLCGGKTTQSNMLSIGTVKSSSPAWGAGNYCEHFFMSLAKKTTNATTTTINDGTYNHTLLLSDSNMAIFGTAQIVAIQETTGSGVAHFCRKFAARRLSGGTVSSLDFSTIGTDYNPSGYSVTSAGSTNGIYAIRVNGDSSATLRWVCSIDGIMVSI